MLRLPSVKPLHRHCAPLRQCPAELPAQVCRVAVIHSGTDACLQGQAHSLQGTRAQPAVSQASAPILPTHAPHLVTV